MQRLCDASESAQLVFELRSGTVLVRGKRAELPPRQARLLAVLAENPGEAIASSELVNAIWPDIPDVAPHELYPIISRLRDSLGDRDLIRNRPRYGYYLDLEPHEVLVAETLSEPIVIKLEDDADGTVPEAAVAGEGAVAGPPRRGLARHLSAALVVAAVIASAWTAGFALSSRRGPAVDVAPGPPGSETVAEEPTDDASEKSAQDRRVRRARNNKKDPQRGRENRRPGAPRPQAPGAPAIAAPAAPPAGPAPAPNTQQPSGPTGASGTKTNETEQKPQTKPEPTYPPPPTISLFHLYDSKSGDHFTTTSSSLASQKEAAGYAKTYVGKVYARSGEALVGISLDSGSAYIFRSSSPKTDPACSTAPLYRLSSNGESFYTSSSSAASQWEASGFTKTHVGYIGAC